MFASDSPLIKKTKHLHNIKPINSQEITDFLQNDKINQEKWIENKINSSLSSQEQI